MNTSTSTYFVRKMLFQHFFPLVLVQFFFTNIALCVGSSHTLCAVSMIAFNFIEKFIQKTHLHTTQSYNGTSDCIFITSLRSSTVLYSLRRNLSKPLLYAK